MVLSSTKLVPELQTYFKNFIVESTVNKYEVPLPVEIPSVYLPQKSFIELLFNENYSYSSYNFLFSEDTNKYGWPYYARNRLMVYPKSAKYLVCDTTGDNVFDVQSHDRVLLDTLLAYRMDSTAVTIVDSTSVVFIDNVLYASYNSISTILAKLIYLYLDFKIYNRYSNCNNTSLVSSGSLLESCYEIYVLDKIFAFILSRGT